MVWLLEIARARGSLPGVVYSVVWRCGQGAQGIDSAGFSCMASPSGGEGAACVRPEAPGPCVGGGGRGGDGTPPPLVHRSDIYAPQHGSAVGVKIFE